MKHRFAGIRSVIVAAILFSFPTSQAQQLGHYLGGVTGLENGPAPPPGLYVAYLPYIYLVHSIKGASGNTVVDNVDLSVIATTWCTR